ncbi:MAG TPA: TIGR02281 family clan AA aspartic protease [Stellaceae bacterium]|nr:TIGR02281 family clan AA aspartic protease [Stellaceae bacterium]
MIGWALRRSLLWIGLSLVFVLVVSHRAAFLPGLPSRPAPARAVAMPKAGPQPREPNRRLVYFADRRGHFLLDAVVNGAPIRMLVDTGATLVALTPRDARAAGFATPDLAFVGAANTANGIVRVAPVTLSEVGLDQLSVYDVQASVIENLSMSLLGMSFLDRLKGYEMRDGKLYISW